MLGEPEIWMAVDICLLLIVCVPVCVIVNVIDAIGKKQIVKRDGEDDDYEQQT